MLLDWQGTQDPTLAGATQGDLEAWLVNTQTATATTRGGPSTRPGSRRKLGPMPQREREPRMTRQRELQLVQLTSPGSADPPLRRKLTDCWATVPQRRWRRRIPLFPVDARAVAPAVDEITATLHPDRSRVLLALDADELTGWVHLHRDPNPLVAHWGTINHLQAHPTYQRRGIGSTLMHRLRRIARDEMGLEQLHLAARGGVGLEDFYTRLGWREIGRWPRKLRLAPDDTRHEILMILGPL